MLKAVHDDQSATLPSGREYKLTKMTHKQRRRVFAFFTKKQREIQNGDFSFLDSAEFEPVEKSHHGYGAFRGCADQQDSYYMG